MTINEFNKKMAGYPGSISSQGFTSRNGKHTMSFDLTQIGNGKIVVTNNTIVELEKEPCMSAKRFFSIMDEYQHDMK